MGPEALRRISPQVTLSRCTFPPHWFAVGITWVHVVLTCNQAFFIPFLIRKAKKVKREKGLPDRRLVKSILCVINN